MKLFDGLTALAQERRVHRPIPGWFLPSLLACLPGLHLPSSHAAESAPLRPSLVFTNAQARLVVDLLGGALGEFRRAGSEINPLHWGTPTAGDQGIHGFGHFLCLDRWGPPSDAEGARGMPYHGEAANVAWTVLEEVALRDGRIEGRMMAKLPQAGLSVRRRVQMSTAGPVFRVEEEVTNDNALGRLYNAVQHPTVGPPFLDERTVVDCNGRKGFAQGGRLPNPEEPSSYWPRVHNLDGELVDVRRLASDPNPNVVTFAIEEPVGWVTAFSPRHRLLLGYYWSVLDYPWVSLWRDVHDGKPAARGLEFGTTGLHQPFPILVQKGRLWERPLYEYLDAGQTVRKSYLAFLIEAPADFGGVDTVVRVEDRLIVRERSLARPRELSVALGNLQAP